MCGGGGQREAKAGEEVTKIPVLLDSMLWAFIFYTRPSEILL